MSKKRNTRKQNFKYLAESLGAEFATEDHFGLISLLSDFKLFRPHTEKKIENIIRFSDTAFKLYVFDFQHIFYTGNTQSKDNQTVLFVQSTELGLPHFLLKPESFWDKLIKWLKIQNNPDIDFEDHPEFSKQYFLSGDHESFVRYTFKKGDVLEFFSTEKNWTLEGTNYFFIFYKKNKIVRVDHLRSFINKGLQLYEWLKEEDEEE